MTVMKDFKRRVRERMAITGESYTTARAAMLAGAGHPTTPRPLAKYGIRMLVTPAADFDPTLEPAHNPKVRKGHG